MDPRYHGADLSPTYILVHEMDIFPDGESMYPVKWFALVSVNLKVPPWNMVSNDPERTFPPFESVPVKEPSSSPPISPNSHPPLTWLPSGAWNQK